MVDAGNGLQPSARLGAGRKGLVDEPVECRRAAVEVVVSVEQVGEQVAVGVAQRQAQRIAELLQRGADVPTERSQDVGGVLPREQTVEDAAPIAAEDVAEHAPDADAAPVEDLLHLVAHAAALSDQRPPVAAQLDGAVWGESLMSSGVWNFPRMVLNSDARSGLPRLCANRSG